MEKSRSSFETNSKLTIRKRFFTKRHYFKGKRYYAVLILDNINGSNYEMVHNLLDSVDFPVAARVDINPIRKENSEKMIKRMLADRISESRISSSSDRGKTSVLNEHIKALKYLSEKSSVEGNSISFCKIVFYLISDHPVSLNSLIQRLTRSLEMIGIDTHPEHFGPIGRISCYSNPLKSMKGNYIIDSENVSRLLPLYGESGSSDSGPLIGIDSDNEKPVFLDLFSGNSYNICIMGETGSGKSFFSKILMARSLITGYVDDLLILDPLEEYNCETFGGLCKILKINEPGDEQIIDEINNSLGNSENLRRTLIVRTISLSSISEETLTKTITDAISLFISGQQKRRRAVLIDEIHTFFHNTQLLQYFDHLYRSSRHHNTAVVSLSQNIDDYLKYPEGKSIINNSSSIFVFRNRDFVRNSIGLITENRFQNFRTDSLLGGKSDPYSECYYYTKKELRKIRVICTTGEVERTSAR